jgi:hypothetical protein
MTVKGTSVVLTPNAHRTQVAWPLHTVWIPCGRETELQRKASPRHHPPLAWPGPLPPTRPARAA